MNETSAVSRPFFDQCKDSNYEFVILISCYNPLKCVDNTVRITKILFGRIIISESEGDFLIFSTFSETKVTTENRRNMFHEL